MLALKITFFIALIIVISLNKVKCSDLIIFGGHNKQLRTVAPTPFQHLDSAKLNNQIIDAIKPKTIILFVILDEKNDQIYNFDNTIENQTKDNEILKEFNSKQINLKDLPPLKLLFDQYKNKIIYVSQDLEEIYLSQEKYNIRLVKLNANKEILNEQNVNENIIRTFRNEEAKYGEGDVLSILMFNYKIKNANITLEKIEKKLLKHKIQKRQNENSENAEEKTEENINELNEENEKKKKKDSDLENESESRESEINFDDISGQGPAFYNVSDKAVLYSTLYPTLRIKNIENGEINEYTLRKTTVQTGDFQKQTIRLIVTFAVGNTSKSAQKITIRIRFTINSLSEIDQFNGYWSLKTIELVDPDNKSRLLETSKDITAPLGFSYHCSGLITFYESNTGFNDSLVKLTFTNLQVQSAPFRRQNNSAITDDFDDAYDCVSFTTVPIWSGLLVTALLGVVLSIALTAIANIKTMDKFDDNKGKPLTLFINTS